MHDHSIHLKLILAAVAGFVVLAAVGVPVLNYLPLLAILAICPLAMVFMMRGMNHGGSTPASTERDDAPAPTGHRH